MRSRAIFWLIEWRRIRERKQRRFALARGVEVEGEQVLALAHLDGGEATGPERVLELAIEPRVVGLHVDGAVLLHRGHRRVVAEDRRRVVDRMGGAEGAQELVAPALLGAAVDAAAADPEAAAELAGDRLGQVGDGAGRGRGGAGCPPPAGRPA